MKPDYPFIDQEKENEYGKRVMVSLLLNRIRIIPMETVAKIAGIFFGKEPTVKIGSDGEPVFTYPKNDDPLIERLAKMMIMRLSE